MTLFYLMYFAGLLENIGPANIEVVKKVLA